MGSSHSKVNPWHAAPMEQSQSVATPQGGARYGVVARVLHWTMVVAIAVQFVVGYAMDRFEVLEWVVDRWLGGEDDRLMVVHAGLGVTILVLATVRATWRRIVGLPPWAEGLSALERRLASRVEKVLYWLMFLIPLTGLALLLVSGEDWDLGRREWEAPIEWADDDVLLGVHITTHLAFFAAFATHVGLVLKHQFVDRDGLLRRML